MKFYLSYSRNTRTHFYTQHQAEVGKNQTKTKKYHEAEFLLLENYSLSSSTLSFKNNSDIFQKNVQKTWESDLMECANFVGPKFRV